MYPIIYHYGLLAVVISSFLVALIGYIKAYEEEKKTLFILVNGAGGLWALCLFIFHTSPQPQIFWLRFSHLAGIFIPVTFVHFVFILLGEVPRRKRQLTLFYLVGSILGSLSFTRLLITGITYNEVMGYHVIPGPVYRIFSVMFFSLIVYGYFLMGKALKSSSGFRKNQIRYCLVASILGLGGGISTFLPIYGINVPPLGILVVPSYGIILAYALLKRRLMDIRTIVSKGLIYSTITVLVFSLLLFIGFTLITFYQPIAPNLKLFLYILGFCFFLVLVLVPLRRKLEQLIENLIFKRARASYDKLTRASQKLLTILDNKTLSRFSLQTVVRTTDVNWGTLWLAGGKNGNYHLEDKIGDRKDKAWLNEDIFLNQGSTLINLLEKERRLLLREEILPLFKNTENEDNLEDRLRKSDFSLVIPLFSKDFLKGCLFLGEKRSGDLFSPYELQALTLFSDQTAMALANAQLFSRIQKMKEYNERIVNNVDSGLIVVDRDGQITTFNRKMEEMIGLACKEVLGKTAKVLPSSLSEIILKCWQTRKPVSIPQLTLKIGQSDALVVNLNVSLIDEKEKKGEIVVILTDFTEVRRLEEKIRQTEKMASVGSMVSQLAHEIKNPLSSIRTFTELLPEKFEDEEFRNKFHSLVSGEIERIDSLITRMLNLGSVDAAQYEMVSIQEVIEDVLPSLDLQLKEQKVRIELSHQGVVPLIWADPQSLKEAFSNILVNSIQAMPQGGKISISTCKKKDRNTGKSLLEISITDEGSGIPQDCLHRVFDPFFTTKQQGSGLGLYICYKIIQIHQGEIRAINTDSGASFTILLPIPENKTHFVKEKRRIYGQSTSYKP